MSLGTKRRTLRTVLLVVVTALPLWFLGTSLADLTPATHGAVLGALTCVLVVKESFFWKAIEGVAEIPFLDSLSGGEAAALSNRVHVLKRRLIGRWFFLLGLEAISGVCAAFLAFGDPSRSLQVRLWNCGLAALIVGVPFAMSFFQVWRQAETVKSDHAIQARRKRSREEALKDLDSTKGSAFNEELALQDFGKNIGKARLTK